MSYTERVQEILGRQAGPFKVWQWGAVGLGALAIVLVARGGGGGAGGALTPADAALPESSDTSSPTSPAPVTPGSLSVGPLPIDPFVAPIAPEPVVAPFAVTQPAPVTFASPEPSADIPTSPPEHIVFTPVAPEPKPALTTSEPTFVGGIATTYIAPSLTSSATVAAGGPTFVYPSTNRAFSSPFQGPFISQIVDVAKSSIAGLAQPGSQIQEVGGVPISLSAEAIVRGGIPARDVPLAPSPVVTIAADHPAAAQRIQGAQAERL